MGTGLFMVTGTTEASSMMDEWPYFIVNFRRSAQTHLRKACFIWFPVPRLFQCLFLGWLLSFEFVLLDSLRLSSCWFLFTLDWRKRGPSLGCILPVRLPLRHLQRGCPQIAGTVWRPLPRVTRGLGLSSCSAFLVSWWGHWSHFVAWVHMWDFFFFPSIHYLCKVMKGKGFQPGALWSSVFPQVDFPPITMGMKIIIENEKSKGEKKTPRHPCPSTAANSSSLMARS